VNAASVSLYFLQAVCGVVLALPFSHYDGSLPAWVALAPVLWSVARAEGARKALGLSAVFALAWTLTAFWFLAPLTAPGMLALCVYTSLYYVAALLASRWLAKKSLFRAVFGTAAIWTLIEIARSTIPILAFPWLLLGHSLVFSDYLRQSADLLGVFGLSFLLVLVNATLAFALPAGLDSKWLATPPSARRPLAVVGIVGTLLLAALLYGALRIEHYTPLLKKGPPIAVIQGNILQKLGRTSDEMVAQLYGHLEMHRQIVAEARTSGESPVLICWAETMVPGSMNSDEWGKLFKAQVAIGGILTLAGSNFTLTDPLTQVVRDYNAAYLLDENGAEISHYFKRKLVPFGEYIPYREQFPFLGVLASITRDQYIPGSAPSPVETIPRRGGSHPFTAAINICVEDIHPDIAREAAYAGADVLLNITNDGWFYGTFGPSAHLKAAALRAVEVRRPMLRVTNTGHTVAIDPLGRIELLLPALTVGTAKARLQSLEGTAPVTLSMRVGEWGPALLFFGIFCLSAIPWERKKTL